MSARRTLPWLRWLTSRNVRSAASRCACRFAKPRTTCRARDRPRRARFASGSAPNATTGKKPKPRGEGLAGAERQQHFLADGVVELLESEGGLALVAQDFDHGWTAFVVHFHSGVVQMDDVHLQGLDQEVPGVPAARTGQRHPEIVLAGSAR